MRGIYSLDDKTKIIGYREIFHDGDDKRIGIIVQPINIINTYETIIKYGFLNLGDINLFSDEDLRNNRIDLCHLSGKLKFESSQFLYKNGIFTFSKLIEKEGLNLFPKNILEIKTKERDNLERICLNLDLPFDK